jgi:serine/threonine-protein kinase
VTFSHFHDRYWIAAAFCAVAAAACRYGGPSEPRKPIALNLEPGPMPLSVGPVIALSPEARIAVVLRDPDGVSRLHTRPLDGAPGLAGTEGARNPFFSPDGQTVGFAAGGMLKKVPVEGGAVAVICDAPDARGASWGDSGELAFTPGEESGLWIVPPGGGSPVALTTLESGERTHRWPHVLPGSEAVLFTSHTSVAGFDDARIEAVHVKTRRRKTIRRGGFGARFVAEPDGSGQLLYARQGTLFAEPFDAAALETRGEPMPLLEGIRGGAIAGASYDVSAAGSLLYVPAAPSGAAEDAGGPMPSRLTFLLNFAARPRSSR